MKTVSGNFCIGTPIHLSRGFRPRSAASNGSQIDQHAEAVDELDVEGILPFAERILPRASEFWVQASLD